MEGVSEELEELEELEEEGEAAEIKSMLEQIRQNMAEFLELEDSQPSGLYTSDVQEKINSDNEV